MRVEISRYDNYPPLFAEAGPPHFEWDKRAVRFGYCVEDEWMQEVTLKGLTIEDATTLLSAVQDYRVALQAEAQAEARRIMRDENTDAIVEEAALAASE